MSKGFIRARPGALSLLVSGALFVAAASLVFQFSGGPPGDTSSEAGFARDMMVHHAQAIEMAEIVRDKSKEIKTLATDITLTQQAQIGQMRGWLDVWGLPITSAEPAMSWMGYPTMGAMPGMASSKEINALRQASPEKADERFLQLMIPHHQAAIPMAEAVLKKTARPEVEQFARAVSASQKAEVQTMKDMLRARGASRPKDKPSMNMNDKG